MNGQVRQNNPLGRMSQNMQETKVEVKSESQTTVKPVQGSRSKSSFDHAEYERWSETLRSRRDSKNK
jgi:hypothetical protein